VEVDAEADTVLSNIAGVVVLFFRACTASGPEVLHPGRLERRCFHGPDDLAEADVRDGIFAKE
jgi:hypothetical protein